MATLDTICTELVQNIAVNLEVDGCFALSQVCRSLRAATIDALLLREVIGTQHTLWNFHSINLIRIAQRLHYDARILQRYKCYALDLDRLGHWDKLAFNYSIQEHFGLDLETWARYAVADLRAFRLCSALNAQTETDGRGKFGFASESSFENTMRFLPHILVLKRKYYSQIQVEKLHIRLESHMKLIDLADPGIHASGLAPALAVQVVQAVQKEGALSALVSDRLAFSYCATMLSQDTPEAPLFGASSPRAAMTAFFKSRCKDFANRLKAAAEVSPSRDMRARRQPAAMTQAEAQIIIGSFSSLLRHAFREYRVRRLIGAGYYNFILPFALDVPMNHGITNTQPPIPFADDYSSEERTWEDWQADQLNVMTSYEFLTQGAWVGCYSYTQPNIPEIDAPMMDVAFDFTSGKTDEASTAIHATGVDSLGEFSLDGDIERTGHVSLIKLYNDGTSWEWNCQMTPFGIGGIWGPQNSDVVNGSVWLWKKEWTQARAAK